MPIAKIAPPITAASEGACGPDSGDRAGCSALLDDAGGAHADRTIDRYIVRCR